MNSFLRVTAEPRSLRAFERAFSRFDSLRERAASLRRLLGPCWPPLGFNKIMALTPCLEDNALSVVAYEIFSVCNSRVFGEAALTPRPSPNVTETPLAGTGTPQCFPRAAAASRAGSSAQVPGSG